MKKSNILLLSGFIAVLLLISTIHLSLYAKYKAGNYSVYNSEEDLIPSPMEPFPHILFVSVRNIPAGSVKFGPVAQVEKGNEDHIQFVKRGDTLLITGRDSSGKSNRSGIAFSLPDNVTLSVFNSFLLFEGDQKVTTNNAVMLLQKSEVRFSATRFPLQFGQLKVVASDSSATSFRGNTQINRLDVTLSNSAIEYSGGHVGQLSIETDSASRISLQSNLLLKANIKTITPN